MVGVRLSPDPFHPALPSRQKIEGRGRAALRSEPSRLLRTFETRARAKGQQKGGARRGVVVGIHGPPGLDKLGEAYLEGKGKPRFFLASPAFVADDGRGGRAEGRGDPRAKTRVARTGGRSLTSSAFLSSLLRFAREIVGAALARALLSLSKSAPISCPRAQSRNRVVSIFLARRSVAVGLNQVFHTENFDYAPSIKRLSLARKTDQGGRGFL